MNTRGTEPKPRAAEFDTSTVAIGSFAIDGFMLLDPAPTGYAHLEATLGDRVIGQPRAIQAVIDAMDRSDMRQPNDNRPIASFAFLGPTGVGKTEMARAIADEVGESWGASPNLIKIDCSAYSHGHEVANLIGSPLGFVGHGSPPVFNPEKIEGQGTVILFDEIEKAASELHRILLQIMDDGLIRTSNGAEVNFRDSIVIMTSNLGAKDMTANLKQQNLGFGAGSVRTGSEEMERLALREFTNFFDPEFVNRLTEKVVFGPLNPDALREVLGVKLSLANRDYEANLGVHLSLSEGVKDYLVDAAATEIHMGARPLVRALEDKVYTQLGRQISAGHVGPGTHVRAFRGNELPGLSHREGGEIILTARTDQALRQKYELIRNSQLREYQANGVALSAGVEVNNTDELPF